MNWTVGRRIGFGFALTLGLALLLAILGISALRNAATAYRAAVDFEQSVSGPSLRLEGLVSGSAVQFLRYQLTRDEEFAEGRQRLAEAARAQIVQLQSAAGTERGEEGWRQVMRLFDRWNAAAVEATELIRAGRAAESLQFWESTAFPAQQELSEAVSTELERVEQQAQGMFGVAQAAATRMQWLLGLGALALLLVGGLSATFLNRAITRPLRETTGVLASSAAEILAATTQQASSATETSAAVVQTSTTVDEVTQTAEQATDRARKVADSAQRTAEIGQRGQAAVEQSVTAMEGVRGQVESIADSILVLAEQAQAISDIISSVDDISEQTNLLAINAAVEAARAGEQGRGFAVVANEIRTLADQSKRSTVQVRHILGEIQRATSRAVMTTERGTHEAAAASQQIVEAGQTIRALSEAAEGAAHTAAQIVASSGQQAVGMTQIREAMSNIQEATQQTLASTREAEETARDLHRLGQKLLGLVGSREDVAAGSRGVY